MRFTACSLCWRKSSTPRLRTTNSTSLSARAGGAHARDGDSAVHVYRRHHQAGLLSSPLRSRFGILLRLEFYTEEELRFIVERSAEVMGVPIDEDGAAEIALRSRGTPRIANRLLRRVRDYAQVRGTGRSTGHGHAALTMLEVDAHGFDEIDRRLLLTIIQKYDGGPVGWERWLRPWPRKKTRLKKCTSRFLFR